MDAEKLKQIERIYHAALEVPVAERESFIQVSCGADENLRREVQSLLAFDKSFDSFIDTPPESIVAEMLFEHSDQPSRIDQKIGHYRIKKLIGKGGMGEVYLAEDVKLNRKVALKFLSSSISHNKNRLRRFEQEAFASSSLNHPNILTIYEFDSENETLFLATEFIEGKTLREAINRQELNLTEILNIAEQTAFALLAAHKAGIVHRDIKPENIMLREDGILKVLDFGLAKLLEEPNDGQTDLSQSNLSRTLPKTESGLMGTVSYISPEQVRGKKVDERSDIWSFGVVLYEMLSGNTPFTGEDSNKIIAAILKGEYLSIKNHLPNIPPELERIVEKSLRLNPTDRYQKINDLLTDLRNLKDEWKFQSKLDQSKSPHLTDENIRQQTDEQAFYQTGEGHQKTASDQSLPSNSSAEYFVETIKDHKSRSLAVLLAFSLLLTGGFVYLKYFSNYFQTIPLRIATEPINQTQISTVGDVVETAISPDGQFLAYIAREGKDAALRVRQLATNRTLTLNPPTENWLLELTFSPDGTHIFYLRQDEPKIAVKNLYRVAALGGTPEKLIDDVDSMVSFSPAGNEITFLRGNPQKQENSIIIANADGSGERILATQSLLEGGGFRNNPVWSPDGKTIATLAGARNGGADPYLLLAIKIADGSITQIGSKQWRWTRHLEWLPEGHELLLNVTDTPGGFTQFWRVSYPEGQAVKVTNDFNRYNGSSLTADGSILATTLNRQNFDVFVAPLDNLSSAKKVRSIAGTSYYGLDWTPDGKIVFSTNAGGNRELWIMDADGNNSHQLTNDNAANSEPVVTNDGRFIVYSSDRGGKFNFWRINLDGSNPFQITKGKFEVNPNVTPDSRWILYFDKTLLKVSIDGGEPLPLSPIKGAYPRVSPDGKFVAYQYQADQPPWPYHLAIVPFGGDAPIKDFGKRQEIGQWLGDSLLFTNEVEGGTNFFSFSIKTGLSKQLTNFSGDRISAFAISKDQKQIAYIRGSVINEAVFIRNFR